ncbi:FG-GAP repeat protein [Aquisphaera giovannonii]|uniref:FG-GAP repeat protein n=1 Tax=Aquisphaera giovannonii TaxID=406548 RepID=A0A5B9W5A3_9BACT|nr:CRTAC1 family protein [Aquisphaera giovannonii]QEH35364.1 FG-GAP repeat protein [Aquisphaera giovannonii]
MIRRALGVLLTAGLLGLAASWILIGPTIWRRAGARFSAIAARGRAPGSTSPVDVRPAAGARAAEPTVAIVSQGFLDASGYNLAYPYTAPIADRGSLAECLAAARGRADRGIAEIEGQLRLWSESGPGGAAGAIGKARLETYAALLCMYDGRFAEAEARLGRAIATLRVPGVPANLIANLTAIRGAAALRRGEEDNCVACLGPSSCLFPLSPEAVHARPDGSRAATGYFLEYLHARPEDLGIRWVLNIAAMTLGEYPDGVPPEFRIPARSPAAGSDLGRFPNVAMAAGLGVRGPNMSGGSLFDDFNGDGWPDVVTTTTDWDQGASFYLNRGDGTFEDRSVPSGLDAQPMALNLSHADYDNDGKLDILIIRGGWEDPYPLTLLHNAGGGRFEDVTRAAGMAEPIASKSAAWGDYDDDGLVDVYVAGEFYPNADRRVADTNPAPRATDPRNRGRLYRNNGDGTFTDVAARAGVLNERWAQGAAWGDYDDDGKLDLFVSNRQAGNRLYRNNGDGTFADVAPELGLLGPSECFACWFWDYDNDGRLDLYVNGSFAPMQVVAADLLGKGTPPSRFLPRLYRNVGGGKFEDATAAAGLNHAWLPMGASTGDIDNDGYPDVYLGTGRPQYEALVPNVLLRNVGGARFEDVSEATGTGHLQKGHGVSFADYDRDGDLDLFVEQGGATPGDKAYNLLFRNPGRPGRHWLEVRLVGTRTNRAALAATLRADLAATPNSPARSIFRQIGPGSSFGGNSLAAWIGLGESDRVESLTVSWPTSRTRQTFRDVPADRSLEITEGAASYRTLAREPARIDPPPRAR